MDVRERLEQAVTLCKYYRTGGCLYKVQRGMKSRLCPVSGIRWKELCDVGAYDPRSKSWRIEAPITIGDAKELLDMIDGPHVCCECGEELESQEAMRNAELEAANADAQMEDEGELEAAESGEAPGQASGEESSDAGHE